MRGFDGKRLTLAKLKYKEQEIFQMYQQAFESFPNHTEFKARYANECMRLALGNNKFSNLINSRTQLLQTARQLFNQLRQAYPDRPQYDELFKKARRKQNQNAVTVDARINADIKSYKKEERRKFKRRFNQNTIEYLESRLLIILQKPQTPARKERVRELYLRIVRKYKKDNSYPQLFIKLNEFYLWDKTDANTLKFIRKVSKRQNNYAFLESIERQNHTEKNTLWSAISLCETIIKRHRLEQVGDLNEVITILENPQLPIVDSIQNFERKAIKCLAYFRMNQAVLAKTILESLGQELSLTSNQELMSRYAVLVARYFRRTNQKPKMHLALSISLKLTDETQSDNLLKLVKAVNENRSNNNYHRDYLMKFKEKLEGNG